MHFVLRCFGAKHDSSSGQGAHNQSRPSTASSQKHSVAATPTAVAVAARPNLCAPTLEVSAKIPQPEVVEADQNGNAGSGGVVQVMADDEGDRQAVDCSFPRRISLGSPLMLFNTSSVATHHSLTLKLQGAARLGSSAPAVDNWVALGSVADGRATADSDRTTACSNHSHARLQSNRGDAPVAPPAGASPGSKTATVQQSQPDSHSQPQQSDPQPLRQSQPLPNPQTIAHSSSDLQSHARTLDPRMPSVLESSADNLRLSPSRWSIGSSNQATLLGAGASKRQASGTVAGCSPAGGHFTVLPPPRPLPAEELAALVSTLSRVRGHWLEALHTVVALAADLLGADSLSVYLLSDSGATHAALACHGDAGGAIRMGMPLPAVAAPGQNQTALQRLYQTGEPQRGSVWNAVAAAANGPPVSTANSGPMALHTVPEVGSSHHSCRVQGLVRGAALMQRLQENPSNPQEHQHQLQTAQPQHQPHLQKQNQQQQPIVALPPDWQAMRVLGGMTDFVAVPLLRGELVIGALQVGDNCTPPEDITGAVPTSRRCRGTAELSVVATFIGTLLRDHEVLCLMGALEAVASAQDVDGLVRTIARHVALFCRMRNHITPGVRVALIRGDAAALALFLDEGATAAAAAAAANLAAGVAGGSTTPVGVLSTAISRHSTVYNLLHATSTVGGGGVLSSGACTPDQRHTLSPGASASGMAAGLGLSAAGRASQLAAGGGAVGGGAPRCVVPLYSPSMGTRDPSSILDTEQLLPAAPSVVGVPASAGPRAHAAGSASALTRPTAVPTGSEDAAGILHVHGNAITSGFENGVDGGEGLSGMAMSTGGDLWPWFASTVGRAKGPEFDGRGDGGRGRTVTGAAALTEAEAGVGDTPESVMARCTALVGLPSVLSDEDMLGTCRQEHVSMVDGQAASVTAAAGADASGRPILPPRDASGGMAATNTDLDEDSLKATTTTEPSLGHGPSAVIVAATAAAVSGSLLIGERREVTTVVQEPELAAAAAAAESVSVLMSLPSALLPVPHSTGPTIAQTRLGAISGGMYGRALAMAGEDSSTQGRGFGQVLGHAMLTRGTVLAEALAVGTGMYISDVAIYMQDGRNKNRDVFLAPSGRGGPAQPTNSIAVTTISHAGLPLVGIYLTYGTPLPASLLNALISKVHAFGAMLGPLLHERLTSGDSELADEWRYLLGEVLDPQAIQIAADEQRSRRSSAAPYNQQQQLQPPQQQQQQPLAQTPPPLTAPPSPLRNLTGVEASQSRRQETPSRGSGVSTADMAEAPAALSVAAESARRRSGHGSGPYAVRASCSRGPLAWGFWGFAGTAGGSPSAATAAIAPLRRSQTADSGFILTVPGPSRAFPSADGGDAASPFCVKNSGIGYSRASVTTEAAAKAVAACTSEPTPSATASAAAGARAGNRDFRNTRSALLTLPGGVRAASAIGPSVEPYDRVSVNRMPLAPPPSPPSPRGWASAAEAVASVPQAPAALPWPGAAAATASHAERSNKRKAPVATASGPIWPMSQHLQQQQQQNQQRQRVPVRSPLCSPSHQPPQPQQRQPLAVRRLLNYSWRGPTTNGTFPGLSSGATSPPAGASSLSVAGPMATPSAGCQTSKLEKAALEGIASGVESRRLCLRNHSGAGRNLDGGPSLCTEYRRVNCGSSISSGAAVLSRSTSGVLGPAITTQTAAATSPPLRQGEPGEGDGLQTAVTKPVSPMAAVATMEGPAQLPSIGDATLQLHGAADTDPPANDNAYRLVGVMAAAVAAPPERSFDASGSAIISGRRWATDHPVHIQLPVDPNLNVAQSSPSAPEAPPAGSEQERLMLQTCEERKSPSVPQPTLLKEPPESPHLQEQPTPSLNPVAAGCPPSPPWAPQQQQQSPAVPGTIVLNGGAVDGSGGVAGAAATAAKAPHSSCFAVSGPVIAAVPDIASLAGTMSMSQLELAGYPRLLPAYLATATRVGSHSGGAAANRVTAMAANPMASSTTASTNSHNVDVELSMQAWHLSSDPARLSIVAPGSRISRPGAIFGSANFNVSQSGGCQDVMSTGLADWTRLVQPRGYPPVPSPLSPGRNIHGGGSSAVASAITVAQQSTRRCSAGGIAPVSPPPPPPQPRIGAGLSRLTTVATAAGVAGSGGAAGGGTGPTQFSDAVTRAPNGNGFSGMAASGAAAAVAAGGFSSGKLPSPMVHRLRSSVRRNTSFNIMADPGVQDTGKVAPLMANLQDKLRSLQAEQVLARLHSKDTSGVDELSGLTILEPLGSGGFGTVFRGIFNGIEVAVKVLCERGAGGRSEAATMREAFELAVMTTISHPHIVQVLSAWTDVILTSKPNPTGAPSTTTTAVVPRSPATEELGEATVVIAMEYCDAGSLADAVSAGRFRQRVPGGYGALQPCMPAIYATLLEIALALRHMHAMLLVHCDLKPANILLKSNMRDPRGFSAKLSDFGLVKMVVEDGTGGGGGVIGRDARTGTVTHMAPELIRATEASKMDASVDIYAFGVLMWELISTGPVYLGMHSEEIRKGVVGGVLRPEFPQWSDEKYRALAEACLSTDPKARPTSAELVGRLRTLLAESGALRDTIMRRPCKNSAFPAANLPGRGGAAAGCGVGTIGDGFPGHCTAAAAGAMLGIGPADFCRPSRLQAAHQPQQHYYPVAPGAPHSRRARSRSFSGNDSSTFPLHIL